MGSLGDEEGKRCNATDSSSLSTEFCLRPLATPAAPTSSMPVDPILRGRGQGTWGEIEVARCNGAAPLEGRVPGSRTAGR